MHIIQQKIRELAQTTNLANLKLREIGVKVGEPHPQKIKHHLNQLFKKGFLKENRTKTMISPIGTNQNKNDLFIPLPIVGSANCGHASMFAEENIEGYLQISKSLLPHYRQGEMFAVKAVGDSMNKANIRGNALENGDYAVVNRQPQPSYDGKYVLSVINGLANIKKLKIDEKNNQVVLMSESSQDYSPIFIHRNDFADYLINGEVFQVIKRPTG